MFIPAVVAADVAWAGAVWILYRLAPSRRIKHLAAAMLGYVGLETLFHVPMEAAAARLMGMLP